MYLMLRPKFKVKTFNPSEVVKAEVKKMGKLRGREAMMAVILVALVAAWVILGEDSGLGGPTLYAVMAMFLGRIITWNDVQSGVAFDVVGLYAAACAMGVGLKFTGGALWMAQPLWASMPDFLTKGDNLAIGVSLLSGTITNFMSDGATVAALGPIVLPMATLADVHAWKVGLAYGLCLFLRQCPGRGNAQQRHRLRHVQGPGDRGAAHGSNGFHQIRDGRRLHCLGGALVLGHPGLLAVPPLADKFLTVSPAYFPSSLALRRKGNKNFFERTIRYGGCRSNIPIRD